MLVSGFHSGAIGRRFPNKEARQVWQISIPVWCDWKKAILHQRNLRERISIPVWCDWKLKARKQDSMFVLFQFQYGAIHFSNVAISIARTHMPTHYLLAIPKPYGLDGYDSSMSSVRRVRADAGFGIPVWCD